jgi:membrane fusion protein, heavy metal efflux system
LLFRHFMRSTGATVMSSATHQTGIASAPTTNTPATTGPHPRFALRSWLARAVPTAAVVTALTGLALWGHFGQWKMPTFSALIGAEVAQVQEWCQEHNVPEAECIECNLSLLPPGKDHGWCNEHGVAQCTLEHPDVAQLKTPPMITPAMLERASRALALRPRPENNSRCALHQRRVQFASTDAIEKAGIDIAIVLERPIIETAVASGEVGYDQTRMAHLSSRVAGTVWQVERQIGDRVHKGDLLALIDAAEIGRAKAEFLQSIAQVRLKQAVYERVKTLAGDVLSGRQYREAEAAWQEARIRLQSAQQSLVNLGLPVRADDFTDIDPSDIAPRIQFLGLPAHAIASLDAASTTSNLFPIRSPLDGVVIDRHVVPGEVVAAATTLFAVADTSRMWLTLHVREEDSKYISPGQPVLFRHGGKDESEIRGSVSWISTAADDQTRTIQVRVDLPNPDGRLRANTFGAGRIVLRDEPSAIVVPTAAVHWDGTCHVVFVRDKDYHDLHRPKFFHVRSVRPGVQDGDSTEIIAGLLPGEVVASKNSVVLEAQLLKSNLGAGCGCADGH